MVAPALPTGKVSTRELQPCRASWRLPVTRKTHQDTIWLAITVAGLVAGLAAVVILNQHDSASVPGQSVVASATPLIPGTNGTSTPGSMGVSPIGTRVMYFDMPPETPIPDPAELAEFRSQLRRRMLCIPDEAIWHAKMLTGTTSWVRNVVKRTTLAVAHRWAEEQPAGDPSNDNSPVVWLVLFENSEQLTHRSRFDLRKLSPPKDATEDAVPLRTTYMAVTFEETGQFDALLPVAGDGKTIEEVFASAEAIPELGSQYLERYPINAANLCNESPGSRPTPGATWVYPTPEATP